VNFAEGHHPHTGFFFDDPGSIPRFDAFMLGRISHKQQPSLLGRGDVHQLLELRSGKEPVFVNDDHLVAECFLQGRIDQQSLDGLCSLKDRTCGNAAGGRLLRPVPPQDLHRLRARSEAGDLTAKTRGAFDHGGKRLRFAGARPATEHCDGIVRGEHGFHGLPLFAAEVATFGAGYEPDAGVVPSHSGIKLPNEVAFEIECGSGGDLAVGTQQIGIGCNGRLHGIEGMGAVDFAQHGRDELMFRHNRPAFKQVFGSAGHGLRQVGGLGRSAKRAGFERPQLLKFAGADLGELTLADFFRCEFVLLGRPVFPDEDGDFIAGERAAKFGFAGGNGLVALLGALGKALQKFGGYSSQLKAVRTALDMIAQPLHLPGERVAVNLREILCALEDG
jgi:hypothetical protein